MATGKQKKRKSQCRVSPFHYLRGAHHSGADRPTEEGIGCLGDAGCGRAVYCRQMAALQRKGLICRPFTNSSQVAAWPRAGLGTGWTCLFANDIDSKKGSSYVANWGDEDLSIRSVADVETKNLPDVADLAWASFPCQDLSLAGAGAGLKGERSGTFWSFWELMQALDAEDRAPRMVVLENVSGCPFPHMKARILLRLEQRWRRQNTSLAPW